MHGALKNHAEDNTYPVAGTETPVIWAAQGGFQETVTLPGAGELQE